MRFLATCLAAGPIALSLCGASLAGPPQVMPPDYNEVFPAKFITQGTPAKTQGQCDATPNAVWVNAQWTSKGLFSESTESTSECIRYFPSDNALGAATAMFFMSGDVVLAKGLGDVDTNPGYRGNNYQAQVANANRHAKDNGVPFVHLARFGMFGSTGNTASHRHSNKEAAVMQAALDAVKAALGYQRISVAGQSGGGSLTGAMLTSGRADLDCVVISSGAVSSKTRLRTSKMTESTRSGYDTTGLPVSEVFDAIDHLDKVATDPKRRVFMLADRRDMAVSYESQREFADKANAMGVKLQLIEVTASDPQFHGTAVQGVRTVGRCLAGLGDADIAHQAAIGAPGLFAKEGKTPDTRQPEPMGASVSN